MNDNFEIKCPRCQKNWGRNTDYIKHCHECDLRYFPIGDYVDLKIGKKIILIWWIDRKISQCIFDNGKEPDVDDPVEFDTVDLDWLPFDVTPEQLKIFMVFS